MATDVDVHWSVGLGELGRRGDALVTQWGGWRSGDHGPGHIGPVILLETTSSVSVHWVTHHNNNQEKMFSC